LLEYFVFNDNIRLLLLVELLPVSGGDLS